MKYKDKEFVEFRSPINAQDTNFMEIINDTVAVAGGARIYPISTTEDVPHIETTSYFESFSA